VEKEKETKRTIKKGQKRIPFMQAMKQSDMSHPGVESKQVAISLPTSIPHNTHQSSTMLLTSLSTTSHQLSIMLVTSLSTTPPSSPPTDTSNAERESLRDSDDMKTCQEDGEMNDNAPPLYMEPQNRHHPYSSYSWPTTKQAQKRRNRAAPKAFKRLPPATQEAFKNALANKYTSVDGYIRVYCLRTRAMRELETIKDRSNEEFIQHVIGLWHQIGGICAATGRQMVWQREDVKNHSELAVRLVTIRDDDEYRDKMVIGNVALVCSDVSAFIGYYHGLVGARHAANKIKQFVMFKRDRPGTHFTKICAEWDATCYNASGTPVWKRLSKVENHLFGYRMASARLSVTQVDRQTPEQAAILADHAIHLLNAQKGRCAISGFRLAYECGDELSQASIDRINPCFDHTCDNIRLTTLAMNKTRSHMPDNTFDTLMILMADCKIVVVNPHQ
jgi:hypothetical protein